jgi:hypothetical protein
MLLVAAPLGLAGCGGGLRLLALLAVLVLACAAGRLLATLPRSGRAARPAARLVVVAGLLAGAAAGAGLFAAAGGPPLAAAALGAAGIALMALS